MDRKQLSAVLAKYRNGRSNLSVLIVDDDETTRQLVARTLRGEDWEVVEAENGHALAKGMKALGTRIALLVNRTLNRSGAVFRERYHLRLLKTPREAVPRTGLVS